MRPVKWSLPERPPVWPCHRGGEREGRTPGDAPADQRAGAQLAHAAGSEKLRERLAAAELKGRRAPRSTVSM